MFGILKTLFGQNSDNEIRKVINEGAFLVDVRSPAEFSSGNVQGSTNIPLDKISDQLEKFKGKENIVVFCRSGNRSGQAKSILAENGFKNVINAGTWQNVDKIINDK